MIQNVLDFLNRNAGALTVVFGAIVAVATVVYARLTAALARETNRMRRTQTDPDVVVRVQSSETLINLIELVVENNGAGAARNLRLDVSPDIECSRGQMLSSIGLFKHGLRHLAPRQHIKTFLFSVAGTTAEIADPQGPFRFTVTVHYESEAGENIQRSFELDLLHLIGIVQIGTPPLKELADSLKDIKTDVHHLATGFTRLSVNMFTRAEVQQEEEEQLTEYKRRKAEQEDHKAV